MSLPQGVETQRYRQSSYSSTITSHGHMVQQRGCPDQKLPKEKNETFLRETLLEIFTESLLIRDKLVRVTFLLSNL